jgi:3-keto-disaccharide hydrolase
MVTRCCWLLAGLLVAFAVSPAISDQCKPAPVAPTETIRLFNGVDLAGFSPWLKKTGHADPLKVFGVTDGTIHVSGEDNGYIATDKEYRDYRLTVEYKWGKRTDGGKYVRNSGILLHATGPDGNANGVWMACFECQLAQGCAGDIIVIPGKDQNGAAIPVTHTAETVLGPDKRPRWKKGGTPRVFTKGQLWWTLHDADFEELLDTRGKNDIENPVGEWNRVECTCAGNRITIAVNGQTINSCYDVFPAAGKILLQSEGFEIYFRTCELKPLQASK